MQITACQYVDIKYSYSILLHDIFKVNYSIKLYVIIVNIL